VLKIRYQTKYGNVKMKLDGHTFDSKKEVRRYQELCLLEAAGEISDLEIHPRYTLQKSFRDREGNLEREITYTADFKYFDTGRNQWIVEDVKSKATKTAAYVIRRKLFKGKYGHIIFREV